MVDLVRTAVLQQRDELRAAAVLTQRHDLILVVFLDKSLDGLYCQEERPVAHYCRSEAKSEAS